MKHPSIELYLHIPFCVRKCAYCDFLSFSCGKEKQETYLKKLLEEIEAGGDICKKYAVSSIFVGGGTPSLTDSEWIVEIFSKIRENYCLEPDAEISLEANPGTLDAKKLSDYRRAGINRLSLGLQSANNEELRLLGRIHTWEEFFESFRLARLSGFSNINVDLMSALPGQTEESWRETLAAVTALSPEHVSAYSLIIEEGTPFYERYGDGAGQTLLPDEETDRQMYRITGDFLKNCGYTRYEISNYARPGYACRHNLGYWSGVPYLGFGLGAASYFQGARFSNTSDMDEYLKSPPGTQVERTMLSVRDLQEEFFFVGLRKTAGVPLAEFEQRFHVRAQEIYPGVMERFIREGAAELTPDGYFRLTEFGLDVSNYVMAEFLQG